MHFILQILKCKKGVETVSAVFMLLLMLAIITGFVAAFTNNNQSAKDQMQIEQERSREQITLTQQTIENNIVKKIAIENTGTIEVQIRALYKIFDSETVFLCDPSDESAIGLDTHIAPAKTLILDLTSLAVEAEATIVASTERGVKTMNRIIPTTTQTPHPSPDTHKYTYGLLEIVWENFEYKGFENNFNPNGQWEPGWVVETDSRYVAWKATVTNIGVKDIVLDELSSFTTIPTSNADLRSWYLFTGPSNSPDTITLHVDVPTDVIFVWSSSGSPESIYSQPTVVMVFLTFFGSFEGGGSYAQTIPFEASITIA